MEKFTYNVTATQFGLAIYQKERTITHDQLIEQCQYWHVKNLNGLIERWNSQPESKITGLKWIYSLS